MGELKKDKDGSSSEIVPEIVEPAEAALEVGKSYISRHDITITANIEFISKKGHLIVNLESKGEEFPGSPQLEGSTEVIPYPSETYPNAETFLEFYYPSEQGKKLFKEFTSKLYSKL